MCNTTDAVIDKMNKDKSYMTVKDLITQLQKHPDDMDVVILDYKMNAYNASSDGTPEGIYADFTLGTIDLGDDGKSTNLAIEIDNHWDYHEENEDGKPYVIEKVDQEIMHDKHHILRDATDMYGSMQQINMMIEELLELAHALHKIRRMSNDQLREGYVDVCDEIADVIIMMEQAKKIFDITTINERVSFKLYRLQDRMSKDSTAKPHTNEWTEVDELLAKMNGGIVKGAKPPPLGQGEVAMPVDMAQLGWISYRHESPKYNTAVDVIFSDGQEVKDVMFWSKEEGFDAQQEPHHLMVEYWRPKDYSVNKMKDGINSENFAESKELHTKCRKNLDGTWHCIHTMTNCPTNPKNNIPID